MDRLASHDKSNDFSRNFVNIIRKSMLVIEPVSRNATKKGRANAMTIAGYLDDMRKKLPKWPRSDKVFDDI